MNLARRLKPGDILVSKDIGFSTRISKTRKLRGKYPCRALFIGSTIYLLPCQLIWSDDHWKYHGHLSDIEISPAPWEV